MNECFFVDHGAKEKIDHLRIQEYAKADGFALDLNTLRWRESDNQSFVMVAGEPNAFLSTMRGEVIDDISVLEKKLECPWNFPVQLELPILLLSRAATSTTMRSSGLNLVLRYWFIRFAIEKGIPFIAGTFVTGSPREKSLREMGYQFFENPLGWQQSTYRSLRPVAVVLLDVRLNGAHALEYCHSKAGAAIEAFPFREKFPELRYVGVL